MIPKEILRKVKHIEVRTRGLVNNIFGGEYHSVFKGRGMTFSEVREYQFGDEIRFIDWNVSARIGHPYIKVFQEEREQTLMLLYDASASSAFGTEVKTKSEVSVEICAVLAFSAIKNNDKVGLIIFTDQIELFIPPKKGKAHVLRLIRELLYFKPGNKQTKISAALEYTFHVLRRRAIVFLISDFIDSDYERPLKTLARKHDLIAIRIRDRREVDLPERLNLLVFEDAETGEIFEFDTSPQNVDRLKELAVQKDQISRRFFKTNKIDVIEINTGEDFVEALARFFKVREKRLAT